jgi:hypothetical protein
MNARSRRARRRGESSTAGGRRPHLASPTVEWLVHDSAGFLSISNGHEDIAPYAGLLREDLLALRRLLQDPRRTSCSFQRGHLKAEKAGRFLLFLIDERALGWTKTCNRVVAVPLATAKKLAFSTDPDGLLRRSEF